MQALVIRMNGQQIHQHFPTRRLPGIVQARVSAMDELLANHPEDERVASVIRQILQSLAQDDAERTAVLCSWLCRHLPDIAVIDIHEQGEEVEVSLQFGQKDSGNK